MKHTYKALAIAGFTALFIGLIFLILGVSFGSYHSIGIGNHGLIFENGVMKEGKESLSSFHQIVLEVEKSNIEFIPSDHYALEYSYEENGELSWNVEQDKLVITGKSKIHFYLFHFSLFDQDETKNNIKIYYPREEILDIVSIDMNVGNLSLKGNHIKRLDVESDLGNIEILNSTIDSSKMDLDLGNLKIVNSTIQNSGFDLALGNLELQNVESENLNVECSLGNIEIDGILKGTSILECSMGSVKLKTSLEEEAYTYRLKNHVGSTRINGKHTSNTIEKGTGENRLNITNNMGDIELEFTK